LFIFDMIKDLITLDDNGVLGMSYGLVCGVTVVDVLGKDIIIDGTSILVVWGCICHI